MLRGHDDHVITCLEFSGSRVVSGSDDNTLKVWSAVTGKVGTQVRLVNILTLKRNEQLFDLLLPVLITRWSPVA